MAMATDRTVIVTGGNSGLGYECARSILEARDGWHVVLAGRSQERSEVAALRLASETSNVSVSSMVLDLASLASVRQFARGVRSLGLPPIGALVCNAGIQFAGETETTQDGLEATFAVNHLGHFLLTNLLLGDLQAPARVVFVSSGTHDPSQKTGMPHPAYQEPHFLAFPEEDGNGSPGLIARRRYTTSKLCNVLCAYELDRRIKSARLGAVGCPIDVFAFDPGLMPGTGLARDHGPGLRFVWFKIGPAIRPLLRWLIGNVHSPEESGKALARLILDLTLEGTGPRYFQGEREIRSSVESYDEAKAAELWEGSAELVGLPVPSAHEHLNTTSKG
jgi:NAD(P)-dependent dehydrogenase (short-subunit alcohol dehydrogenase family)